MNITRKKVRPALTINGGYGTHGRAMMVRKEPAVWVILVDGVETADIHEGACTLRNSNLTTFKVWNK